MGRRVTSSEIVQTETEDHLDDPKSTKMTEDTADTREAVPDHQETHTDEVVGEDAPTRTLHDAQTPHHAEIAPDSPLLAKGLESATLEAET